MYQRTLALPSHRIPRGFHIICLILPPKEISCAPISIFHDISPRYWNVSGKHLFLRETISPLVHVQEAIALGANVDENTLAFRNMDVFPCTAGESNSILLFCRYIKLSKEVGKDSSELKMTGIARNNA